MNEINNSNKFDNLIMNIDSDHDNDNDSDSDNSVKEVTNVIKNNENLFLYDNWNIWFHDPFDQNWGKESYKFLYKIDTIQNFWKITKLIEDKADIGMFFLFI